MVSTFSLPYYYRGLGPIDFKQTAFHFWLHEINHTLMKELSPLPNVFLIDSNRWLNAVGPQADQFKTLVHEQNSL